VSRELLLACSPGEVWAALIEGRALAGLRVLRGGGRGRAGEVFLGRVVALRPELPAALVDLGLGRAAFLSGEDAGPGGIGGLTEGAAVLVQVSKEARGDKATGLTMRPRLAGRLLVLTPTRPGVRAEPGFAADEVERLTGPLRAAAGEGFVLRAAAAGADGAALAQEAEALRARWRAIEAARQAAVPPALLEEGASPVVQALEECAAAAPEAVILDDRAAYGDARRWLLRHQPNLAERLQLHREATPLFEAHGIAEAVASALVPEVVLAGGGRIAIEQTRAAVMIDVDMSGAGGGRDAAAAALAANLAAAREVARQIRLRGLAGPIVVDFIGMRRRAEREQVGEALAAALGGEGELLGWTRLGHLELVRPRRQAPLAELLFERALGGGSSKTPLTVALEAVRAMARAAATAPPRAPALHLHPEVAAALDGQARAARQELERRLGRPVAILVEPGRARGSFDIRLD
jgi:ribonuclease G